MELVWMGEALARQKTLPALDTLTGKAAKKTRGKMDWRVMRDTIAAMGAEQKKEQKATP